MIFFNITRNFHYRKVTNFRFKCKRNDFIILKKNMSNTFDLIVSSQNSESLLQIAKSIFPPLTYNTHKGQAGRIGIVGGCSEYTGAPYFAGISALKVGCDLVHIFCTNDAAPVIKSYSPELIVHATLDKDISETYKWMERLHALVVGPGLGRDKSTLEIAQVIIEKAKQLNLPLVIDADGLYLITLNPSLIKGYKKAILTPNAVEFARLHKVLSGLMPSHDAVDSVFEASKLLGNVVIVRKGENDIISNGHKVLICQGENSPRRCGGQGDLLSGSLGVFAFWSSTAFSKEEGQNQKNQIKDISPSMYGAYAACMLTRECNRLAFVNYGRSTTTTDMIAEICNVLKSWNVDQK